MANLFLPCYSRSIHFRFLHETIQDYVLTPTLLPHLLLASRTAFFPLNNNVSAAQAVDGHRAAQTPAPHVSAQPPASPQVEGGSGSHASASRTRSSTSSDNEDHPKSATKRSAPEIAAIRRQCAASLLALIPRPVARLFLGTDAAGTSRRNRVPIDNRNTNNDQLNGSTNGHNTITDNPNTSDDLQRQRKLPQAAPPPSRGSPPSPSPSTLSPSSPNTDRDEEEFLLSIIENEFLDLLEDEYCNKHLVYSILETVLGRLLPELGERSIGALLEDRGVSLPAAVSSAK